MAIDTTIDNAVIDFTQISNLLQTLKSHDDLFMKFANGSLGSTFNLPTDTKSSDVSASNFQLAAVTYADKMTSGSLNPKGSISFGKTFIGNPIVVATIFSSSTSLSPVVYITNITPTDCTIIARDVSSTKFTGGVIVNIMAFGVAG